LRTVAEAYTLKKGMDFYSILSNAVDVRRLYNYVISKLSISS
jgi:hypothetical protein